MAARKRRPARSAAPPWWHRFRLESGAAKAGALLTLFALVSFLFGTTKDLVTQVWRHYTGAELAYTLEPEVRELRKLTAQALELTASNVDRIDLGEKRLKKAEQTLDAATDSKRIEQEREGAVEKAQRGACITGELASDTCNRLGYPTKQK